MNNLSFSSFQMMKSQVLKVYVGRLQFPISKQETNRDCRQQLGRTASRREGDIELHYIKG